MRYEAPWDRDHPYSPRPRLFPSQALILMPKLGPKPAQRFLGVRCPSAFVLARHSIWVLCQQLIVALSAKAASRQAWIFGTRHDIKGYSHRTAPNRRVHVGRSHRWLTTGGLGESVARRPLEINEVKYRS